MMHHIEQIEERAAWHPQSVAVLLGGCFTLILAGALLVALAWGVAKGRTMSEQRSP